MQENPAYLDAESRVFSRFGLTPTVRPLEPTKPPLRLRVAEVGSGEPVLFLHGWSLCTATWAPLVAHLPGVRSLMLDAPGHGAADTVDYRGIDLRRWFDAMLKGCLDELGLETAHVVGHSMGAMFALWLALAAPEHVRSVVAIGVPAVAFGARIESLRVLGVLKTAPSNAHAGTSGPFDQPRPINGERWSQHLVVLDMSWSKESIALKDTGTPVVEARVVGSQWCQSGVKEPQTGV